MSAPLPRGVWFEEDRSRYRIRRYRNGRAYVRYRDTPDAALKAYDELSRELAAIPKLPRGARRTGAVPVGTFTGLTQALLLTSKS
jgi:hypothetical protein